MAYKKITRKFRNATEIAEYHTARYGAPGEKRKEKKKVTPELMKKRNQYNKERLARWKLREHFDTRDYFSTLTYRKDARPPDMLSAKADLTEFWKFVRKEYRKRGCELRWMRNIECGTKGAWHVHLVINRIPDTDIILQQAWKHGKVMNTLLHEKGEFRELAGYITKTPETDPRLKESSYSTSRNLPLPEPEEKTYKRWKTWQDIKIPAGYYLDQDSFHEGVNPFTGFRYRTYTLLKVRRGERAGGNFYGYHNTRTANRKGKVYRNRSRADKKRTGNKERSRRGRTDNLPQNLTAGNTGRP